jgi:tRNA-intron endonuclease
MAKKKQINEYKKEKKLNKQKIKTFTLEINKSIKIKQQDKKFEEKEIIPIIKATLSGERVVSKEKSALDLYNKSRFGEIIDGKVYYPLVESLFLVERKKMNVYDGKKKFSFDKFLEIAQKLEPNFYTRFCVFRDMRSRGYIVKTALKFGADFRVYARGIKPGEDHARWVLFPVYETSGLTWHEFAAKNRVAHSTRKNLLIGIVDEEGDVTYYEIRWTRP